ncbi:hypothetical protein RZS08_26680, partial [Arthrospira platensis SPKY1]|nr:hypothetical protein [Arthrospira platensis SPKY1]
KKGNFHETEYHIYEFLNHLKMYFKAAKRFVRKLRSEEELVFHFDSNYLYTFRALPASKTRFLKRENHNSQKPDISNIQLTTSFINQLIHEALDGEFPLAPFNKGHILDTREAEGMIFNLLAHCDVELFNSGDLYVFFSLHATAELAQD